MYTGYLFHNHNLHAHAFCTQGNTGNNTRIYTNKNMYTPLYKHNSLY